MVPIIYVPDFMADSGALFDDLWNDVPWERRSDAPRRECWMNDLDRSYTYGRGAGQRTYEPKPWHAIAKSIQTLLWEEYGHRLAGCFLNGYEGPRDHLGWHADDDPKIDHAAPIAIVSFGYAREIWFRENGSDLIEKLLLENGSLALMAAGMQQTHQHRIPKNSNMNCGRRISLTYRGLVP